MTSPTAPPGYSWEATTEQVAARYGVPAADVLRFDLNTAAEPPEVATDFLRAGRFGVGMSEYPPSDYRRLVAAAAARYGVDPAEILVGAGADEILDLVAKAFLPVGSAAVVPVPTYAMYRVLTDQRPARTIAVPRLGPDAGFALDVPAVRAAARDAAVVWLCSPNNPTAASEPDGTVEDLLAGLADDATADARLAPVVVLDEAYAEFVGTTLVGLRTAYPRLIVVRTASKAYGLAGLRVGFAVSQADTIAAMEPYRPPGSVSVLSVEIVTRAFETDGWLQPRVAAIHRERDRLAAGLAEVGWTPLPSVTNFLLVPFGTPERAAAAAEGLLQAGIVPRTFGAAHPLADHLRITVR
ncbi:MAG TPA: aminotransferase class I/II-fold pyridoxal phosphate-dependent enzyme, partial [Candidatus Acidoferrum sp.]|nr:aminotransferase class I/II-fold pyridoxal phosphate-dependent enzyme [Candidatus Acidoferrum sp.]